MKLTEEQKQNLLNIIDSIKLNDIAWAFMVYQAFSAVKFSHKGLTFELQLILTTDESSFVDEKDVILDYDREKGAC